MKKAFSLDYSIERDTERLAAVEKILDSLDTPPSSKDLELMGSYILYGVDENGLNAVKRGEVLDNNKRYKTYVKRADRNESLEEFIESPQGQQVELQPFEYRNTNRTTNPRQQIRKPKYDKEGNLVDPGDSDIPTMQDLWDAIAHVEKTVRVNEGKEPYSDDVSLLRSDYDLYKLKHALVDMRRQQYYLKDMFKPTLHFVAIVPPRPQLWSWDEDSAYWVSQEEWQYKVEHTYLSSTSRNLEDYETRTLPDGTLQVRWVIMHHDFDWENVDHVKILMKRYSDIYMQVYDKPDSWARAMLFDFDRYFDMCEFSPEVEYIVTRYIDRAKTEDIVEEVKEKFGITYNNTHLYNITEFQVPRAMVTAAARYRQMLTFKGDDLKQCHACHRSLPRTNLFFSVNRGRKDNLNSICKECEKMRRIRKGAQTPYDRRRKDTKMSKVPARAGYRMFPDYPKYFFSGSQVSNLHVVFGEDGEAGFVKRC